MIVLKRFRRPAPGLFVRAFFKLFLGLLVLLPTIAAAQQLPAAQRYLLSDHIHGVDFNVVTGFGSEILPWLRDALASEKFSRYEGNLVTALGILGQASDEQRILTSFRKESGRLSPVNYRARHACLIALGYLGNRTAAPSVIRFLRSGTSTRFWSDTENLTWLPPGQGDERQRNIELTSTALLALALTGADEAMTTLDNVTKSLETQQDSNPQLLRTARQARLEALKVRQMGLANYYRQ